jgi:cellulose synthase/poly-beta-1,6-N-acetylglucosamine synthase-like glycosyltransferase
MALVSVLMVCHNHRAGIERAVASVLSQKLREWELVIFDDGSSDGTLEAARKLASLYPEKLRVCMHEGHANLGIAKSYKAGIAECRGEYVAFLEPDDEWRSDNLRKKVAALESRPGASVAYSDVEVKLGDGASTPGEFYLRRFRGMPHAQPFNASRAVLAFNPIPTFSCAVARRGLLEGLSLPGQQDEIWTDWHVWNQLALRGTFYFIPERLTTWLHHSESAYGRLKKQGLRRRLGEMRQRAIFLSRSLSRPFRTQ